MNISYQGYVNKVIQTTLTTNYQQQLKFIQSSPKFSQGKAMPFPGYTIMTPPQKEDIYNDGIYQSLIELQNQLHTQLEPDFFVPLPPETFHVTVADLIWNKEYLNAVKEKEHFEQSLITQIDHIFTESAKEIEQITNLDLEVIGISIFPRAITVCFIPTEESYEPLMKIRQLIYQNEQIINLGIEQHYDFIGHVTLGYLQQVSEDLDRNKVGSIITEINNQWIANDLPMFNIKQWELRKFEDMVTYIRQPEWARINLVK